MERLNVVQERLFYFLNTIRGSTVLRHRWDGVTLGNPWFLDKSTCTEMKKEKLEEDADTDKVIDYTIGFMGYDYKKITTDFQNSICLSITLFIRFRASIKVYLGEI